MPTPRQILNELDLKQNLKKMVIKTRYSKIKDLEEFSPDEERIKKYANNFFNNPKL